MNKIILVGTGPMAEAYIDVLKAFPVQVEVVGRGELSAKKFFESKRIKPFVGGLEFYLKSTPISINSFAIVATGTENLLSAIKMLVQAGVSRILVEKPAAISIEELLENENFLRNSQSNIFVAYNRRFYSSVLETRRLIQEDGGLKSMHFEFTEWAHVIEDIKKAEGVKENWFFANSTHVIDLAFFLAGNPAQFSSFSSEGKISWHKKTNYVGAGITNKGVLFSYISNWESAGRWAIELFTEKRRIYLKPIEDIQIQLKGSVQLNKHEFDNTLDQEYKPGLYLQIKNFLEQGDQLLKIQEHILNTKNIYYKVIN